MFILEFFVHSWVWVMTDFALCLIVDVDSLWASNKAVMTNIEAEWSNWDFSWFVLSLLVYSSFVFSMFLDYLLIFFLHSLNNVFTVIKLFACGVCVNLGWRYFQEESCWTKRIVRNSLWSCGTFLLWKNNREGFWRTFGRNVEKKVLI